MCRMKSRGPERTWHSCKSRPHLTLAVFPVFTDSREREDLSRASSDFSTLMPFAVGGHLKRKKINPVTPFGPAAKRNMCTEGGRWGKHPPNRNSNLKRLAPNPSVDNDELCSLGRMQRWTEFHMSTYAPKPDGNNPARSHHEPNMSLSEHECDVWQWITRHCSGTFNLIFLSNCGWYNVQQSLQGQENKVIDAQGQGSHPTSRCTLSNDLNLFPACPSEADTLITERTQSSAVMWFYNRHSPRTALACLCRQGSFCFSSPLMQCV